MRLALGVLVIFNLVAVLGLVIVALFHQRSGPAVWTLIGIVLLTLPVTLYTGFRRRLERGRNAGLGLGFNVGIVDVIEGVSGHEMTKETRIKVQVIGGALAAILALAAIALALRARH